MIILKINLLIVLTRFWQTIFKWLFFKMTINTIFFNLMADFRLLFKQFSSSKNKYDFLVQTWFQKFELADTDKVTNITISFLFKTNQSSNRPCFLCHLKFALISLRKTCLIAGSFISMLIFISIKLFDNKVTLTKMCQK